MNIHSTLKSVLCAALIFTFINTAHSATITVDGTDGAIADDGACSISEAIIAANTDAVVSMAAGECIAGSGTDTDIINLSIDITLTTAYETNSFGSTGTPTISSPIILDGMGFSIDRDGACLLNNSNVDSSEYRLMHISASGDLTLNNITLSGGCADGALFARIGGAILNDGDLSLNNSTISGNESTLDGGGIYNSGTISIIQNSTFSENNTQTGGGIYNDDLITTIQNSTFSGNSSIVGGGISNSATINTIQNSTFSGNSAFSSGGGIYNDSSTTVLSNSLFYQNTSGGNECFGNFSGANNISDNATSNCHNALTTLTIGSVDSVLADNGGPTMTHALLPGSEAIDAGDGDSTSTDQRGFVANGTRDIGAFEAQPSEYCQDTLLQADSFTTSVANPTELNQAIVCANLNGSGTDTINLSNDVTLTTTFEEDSIFGSTGTPAITNPIIIDGMGFGILRGGDCILNFSNDLDDFRLLRIKAGGLTLNNTTLSNGCADGSGSSSFGGAIYNQGILTINNSELLENSAISGGGIYNDGTIITIENSSISENQAQEFGGGIYNDGTITTIQNTTLSSNSAFSAGGIINNDTITTIQNSTFSGNSVTNNGGGINNLGDITTIQNSTFSGNSVLIGNPAISNQSGSINMLRNSLFHNNTGGTTECDGSNFSGSNNISSSGFSGCPGVLATTLSTDTIGLLADNGGPTKTHALLPGSEAIDVGDVNSTVTDQRGFAVTNTRDIGAFESFVPVVAAPINISVEATGPQTSPALGSASVSDVDEMGLIAIASQENNFALGMTTVTWSATDSYGFTGSDTQVVTIVDTTAPEITLIGANPQIIQETENYTELGATATDLVDDDMSLTATIVINDSDVNTDVPGLYEVTYNVMDTAGNLAVTVSRTVEVTADIPVANNDSYFTNEDTDLNSVGSVLTNDNDPDNEELTVVNIGVSTMIGMGGSINLSANGTFVYTPVADISGTDELSYLVTDGTHTVAATITITVNPVNDAPTFTVMGNVDVTGLVDVIDDFVEVPGFIENVVFGPTDESGQSIDTITAMAVDPDNVINAVTIDNNGLLRIDINIGNYGAAIVEVQLKDDGGTANGGEDTSEIVEFMVIYDDLIFGDGFEANTRSFND